MPVYFGGRKVKELYLGGRKIKEAWYGGKKVYSSMSAPAWKVGTTYHVGDVVYHNGEYYKCNFTHTVDPAWDEPGVGSIWTGYWDKITNPSSSGGSTPTNPPGNGGSTPTNPPTSSVSAWRAGANYKKGDQVSIDVYGDTYRYTALTDHYSSTDSKPFYGSVENLYWEKPTKIS